MTFFDRTPEEQEIICKAYEFEIDAIENLSTEPNPYAEAILKMGLLDALNEAVAMAFNH